LLHKLIGFYNRVEKCLQRGTNSVFKWTCLGWVFKGPIYLFNVCLTQTSTYYAKMFMAVFYRLQIIHHPNHPAAPNRRHQKFWLTDCLN